MTDVGSYPYDETALIRHRHCLVPDENYSPIQGPHVILLKRLSNIFPHCCMGSVLEQQNRSHSTSPACPGPPLTCHDGVAEELGSRVQVHHLHGAAQRLAVLHHGGAVGALQGTHGRQEPSAGSRRPPLFPAVPRSPSRCPPGPSPAARTAAWLRRPGGNWSLRRSVAQLNT